MLIHSLP